MEHHPNTHQTSGQTQTSLCRSKLLIAGLITPATAPTDLVMPSKVPAKFGAKSWWEHRNPLFAAPAKMAEPSSTAIVRTASYCTKHKAMRPNMGPNNAARNREMRLEH